MQGAPGEGPNKDEPLARWTRSAARRYRLERLASASRSIAWALAGTLAVVLLLAAFTPLVGWTPILLGGMLLLALVGAAVLYAARIDRRRLHARIDSRAGLPDVALSAGDWEQVERDAWKERQRLQAQALLANVDWRRVWPIRWPRLLWLPLACCFLFAAGSGLLWQRWETATRAARQAEAKANAPLPSDRLKPLEEVFRDWDEAQKIAPSPELDQLLKEIAPLRRQMAEGKIGEKQLLLKLNDVQQRLQQQRAEAEKGSLEPLAQSLSDAVRDLDAMGGLAAALQRKDYAAARDQAEAARDKYASGQAQMPDGDRASQAASRLGDLAQKASGNNPEASSAMRQMQQAAQKKDGQEMAKGLSQLRNSLAGQCKSQSQCRSLSLQMAQLNACKNGMCKNPGISMGMPQLSLAKSLQPGKGAGSTTDPNRDGPPTQIDASRHQETLSGTAGEGNSETKTESSQEPHLEQSASAVTAAQFADYKKLSDQAAEDENLPAADRQMIKRYFEGIRPQGP